MKIKCVLHVLSLLGDVVHVEVLGNHLIFLNTLQATADLFEKRSFIYSDRPRMPMLKELSDSLPSHARRQ